MEGVDYSMLGMSMEEIGQTIVDEFVAGIERGTAPDPINIQGAPGCGKTMTVYDSAERISKILGEECKVYCIATSCVEPTDIQGVPFPVVIDGESRYTSYLPTEWAWEVSVEYEQYRQKADPKFKAPPAILFFDDLPSAHFQTQTAFFKGVHEGMWGDAQARPNVMTVAAGNRVEDNAGANDMPTALANRFLHLYANPTTEDWIRWAQTKGKINPFVVAYIRKQNEDLNEFDSEVANRSEKAFASARSWHRVSNFLNSNRVSKDSSRFQRVIFGHIGYGVGTRFMAFLNKAANVVSPEEIVKNPRKAPIPKMKHIDALHATVTSLEHYVREHPKQWKPAAIYAAREEMLPEIGMFLAGTVGEVIQRLLPFEDRTEALGSDEMVEFMDRFGDILGELAQDGLDKK